MTHNFDQFGISVIACCKKSVGKPLKFTWFLHCENKYLHLSFHVVSSLRWCVACIIWQFDSELTNWEIRPSVFKSQPSSSTTRDDDVNSLICGEYFSNSRSKEVRKLLTSHLLVVQPWNLTHIPLFPWMGGTWCNICNAFSGVIRSARWANPYVIYANKYIVMFFYVAFWYILNHFCFSPSFSNSLSSWALLPAHASNKAQVDLPL